VTSQRGKTRKSSTDAWLQGCHIRPTRKNTIANLATIMFQGVIATGQADSLGHAGQQGQDGGADKSGGAAGGALQRPTASSQKANDFMGVNETPLRRAWQHLPCPT
jgi:hypothetical protein